MPLSKTNISIDTVRRYIGSAKTDIAGLCKEDKVNMFSYYKPMIAQRPFINPTEEPNWPDNFGSWYDIEVPKLTFPVDTSKNWMRVKPYGGALSPYRLTDFGGYDHYARPCISSGCTAPISINMSDSGYTTRTFSFEQIAADSKTNVSVQNIPGLKDYYFGFCMLESLSRQYGPVRTCDMTIGAGGNSLTVDFANLNAGPSQKYLLFLLSKVKSTGVGRDSYDISEMEVDPLVIYHDSYYLNPVPLNIFYSLLFTAKMIGINAEGLNAPFEPFSNFASTPLQGTYNDMYYVKVRLTNLASHTISCGVMFDVEVVSFFGTTEEGTVITYDENGDKTTAMYLEPGQSRDCTIEIEQFRWLNGDLQLDNIPTDPVTTHIKLSYGEDLDQTANFMIKSRR